LSAAIIVKMDSVVVSGTDLKLVASTANRKILSAGGTSNKPKDLRDSVFYIEGGAKCSCNQLNTSDRSRGARTQTKINNSAARYLVMGQRRNGRLTVSFIQSADQKATDSSRVIADSTKRSSNEMGKALKSLRRGKDRICNQKGVQRIASTSNVIEPSRKRSIKKNEGKKTTVRKDGWWDEFEQWFNNPDYVSGIFAPTRLASKYQLKWLFRKTNWLIVNSKLKKNMYKMFAKFCKKETTFCSM